jgi:DNA-binding transcriptional ArsR family regulator
MDRASLICARLIREGAVPRNEIPDLDLPDVRREVEERLSEVGLELATSAYSDHVGVRLSPAVTSEPAFDAASNAGLGSDACALLVVLWARLALQKRTAADSRLVPGRDQGKLFPRESAEEARGFTPQVRVETLMREFGNIIGSRTHLKRILTQLRRVGFVAGRGEIIEAGPLLELGIDGERMIAYIRRGVLAQLLEEKKEKAGGEPLPGETMPENRVLAALRAIGGQASIRQLEEATGLRRPALHRSLKALEEEGKVKKTGKRAGTRYQAAEVA